MQKCTLCVDRIHNETLDPADRQPACVAACPTRARHFGDLGDAESPISKLVAERDGYALMPEFGYKPVNRYLPPRPRRDGCDAPSPSTSRDETLDRDKLPGVLRWLDRALSR
jgi:Fe-S-cluster-containing dehydrogenase component